MGLKSYFMYVILVFDLCHFKKSQSVCVLVGSGSIYVNESMTEVNERLVEKCMLCG